MIGRRHLLAVGVVAFLLFLHAPRTMTEDALMEEEAESNDSTEGPKKIKAKNNKEDEDAFRDLEPPEVEGKNPFQKGVFTYDSTTILLRFSLANAFFLTVYLSPNPLSPFPPFPYSPPLLPSTSYLPFPPPPGQNPYPTLPFSSPTTTGVSWIKGSG